MRCPECDAIENRVVDTRGSRGGHAVRRRRECGVCSARFTTYEHIEERNLYVLKQDGRTEEFDRTKLSRSITIACTKRPITQDEIEVMVDLILDNLTNQLESEISASYIGEIVMEHLAPLDRVAYIRFASVYRNFQDIGEFQEVVRDLSTEEERSAQSQNQEEFPF